VSLSPQLPRQGLFLTLNTMKPSSQVRNAQRWRKQEVREVDKDRDTERSCGREVGEGDLDVGDVIQLANESGDYYHTLLVSGFDESGYLVAAHSNDALDRPLATYSYDTARYLRVEGARIEIPDRYRPICFMGLIEGESIGGMRR